MLWGVTSNLLVKFLFCIFVFHVFFYLKQFIVCFVMLFPYRDSYPTNCFSICEGSVSFYSFFFFFFFLCNSVGSLCPDSERLLRSPSCDHRMSVRGRARDLLETHWGRERGRERERERESSVTSILLLSRCCSALIPLPSTKHQPTPPSSALPLPSSRRPSADKKRGCADLTSCSDGTARHRSSWSSPVMDHF